MLSAARAIWRSGRERREASTTASPTLTAIATATATRKIVVTAWSNMSCASVADEPAWTMSCSKVDCATTRTPTAMTPIAISATRTDTTVIPAARLRSRRIAGLGDGSVAEPSNGHDVARRSDVLAELVTQTANVDVHRALQRVALRRAVQREIGRAHV